MEDELDLIAKGGKKVMSYVRDAIRKLTLS